MKLQLKMYTKTLVRKCLILKIKYYNDSNKLVVGKMKNERIKEFAGLKPNIDSFLVDDSSEYKKAKTVNKNIFARIIHNEYEDVLLNEKCLRHLINRIQLKDHRIGVYEINNFFFIIP